MPVRCARSPVFVALLILAAPGCADPPLPPQTIPRADAPPERVETPAERCARMADAPHAVQQARKLTGEPAYLTPEGAAAHLPDAVPVRCTVSRRGHACSCEALTPVPPSQEASLRSTLETWRFQPGTYDGKPTAATLDLEVPIVAPPPGWAPPLPPLPPPRVIPFGEDMVAPTLVSGPAQPAYTRDALERCAHGKVVARCTITVEGRLVDCDVVQSVPYLDQVVLDLLSRQAYSPVLYRGRPQSVFYTLTFRFELPRFELR